MIILTVKLKKVSRENLKNGCHVLYLFRFRPLIGFALPTALSSAGRRLKLGNPEAVLCSRVGYCNSPENGVNPLESDGFHPFGRFFLSLFFDGSVHFFSPIQAHTSA